MKFKNNKKEDLALLSEFAMLPIIFELQTKNDLAFSKLYGKNQLRFHFHFQSLRLFIALETSTPTSPMIMPLYCTWTPVIARPAVIMQNFQVFLTKVFPFKNVIKLKIFW